MDDETTKRMVTCVNDVFHETIDANFAPGVGAAIAAHEKVWKARGWLVTVEGARVDTKHVLHDEGVTMRIVSDAPPFAVPVKTKRYFTCPNGCPGEHDVEHLFERHLGSEAGPWVCHGCGDSWHPMAHADGTLTVCKNPREKWVREFVVLEIPPQTQPIRFLLDRGTTESKPEDREERLDHAQFFYEEHTCPTNWLRDVHTIAIGGDTDPHGIAKVVAVFAADSPEGKVLAEVCDAQSNANYPEGWKKLLGE